MLQDVDELRFDTELYQRWNLVCTFLVEQCIATVNPATCFDDTMSLLETIKVKCIPHGGIEECACLDGVLFRKNVTHKGMQREIERPRVLLLKEPLAYGTGAMHGGENGGLSTGITSLAAMQSQENDYLRLQVEKIARLRPTAVVFGSAVSGRAQELLLAKGITVVQHVKAKIMWRLSRLLRCNIVKSTHQIHNSTLQHMMLRWPQREQQHPSPQGMGGMGSLDIGSCEKFAVEGIDVGAGTVDTYMRFTGCPLQLGCSIVLRGGDRALLKKVKGVLWRALYRAYDWKLQSSLVHDSFLTVSRDSPNTLSLMSPPDSARNEDGANAVAFSTTSLLGTQQKVNPYSEVVSPYSGMDQTLGQYLLMRFGPLAAMR